MLRCVSDCVFNILTHLRCSHNVHISLCRTWFLGLCCGAQGAEGVFHTLCPTFATEGVSAFLEALQFAQVSDAVWQCSHPLDQCQTGLAHFGVFGHYQDVGEEAVDGILKFS